MNIKSLWQTSQNVTFYPKKKLDQQQIFGNKVAPKLLLPNLHLPPYFCDNNREKRLFKDVNRLFSNGFSGKLYKKDIIILDKICNSKDTRLTNNRKQQKLEDNSDESKIPLNRDVENVFNRTLNQSHTFNDAENHDFE